MGARLTERIHFLTDKEQRERIDANVSSYGSAGELIRQAIDNLLLSDVLSASKQDASKQTTIVAQ